MPITLYIRTQDKRAQATITDTSSGAPVVTTETVEPYMSGSWFVSEAVSVSLLELATSDGAD